MELQYHSYATKGSLSWELHRPTTFGYYGESPRQPYRRIKKTEEHSPNTPPHLLEFFRRTFVQKQEHAQHNVARYQTRRSYFSTAGLSGDNSPFSDIEDPSLMKPLLPIRHQPSVANQQRQQFLQARANHGTYIDNPAGLSVPVALSVPVGSSVPGALERFSLQHNHPPGQACTSMLNGSCHFAPEYFAETRHQGMAYRTAPSLIENRRFGKNTERIESLCPNESAFSEYRRDERQFHFNNIQERNKALPLPPPLVRAVGKQTQKLPRAKAQPSQAEATQTAKVTQHSPRQCSPRVHSVSRDECRLYESASIIQKPCRSPVLHNSRDSIQSMARSANKIELGFTAQPLNPNPLPSFEQSNNPEFWRSPKRNMSKTPIWSPANDIELEERKSRTLKKSSNMAKLVSPPPLLVKATVESDGSTYHNFIQRPSRSPAQLPRPPPLRRVTEPSTDTNISGTDNGKALEALKRKLSATTKKPDTHEGHRRTKSEGAEGDKLPMAGRRTKNGGIEKGHIKACGGYAYDHRSLPIIVAVHSIAIETKSSGSKEETQRVWEKVLRGTPSTDDCTETNGQSSKVDNLEVYASQVEDNVYIEQQKEESSPDTSSDHATTRAIRDCLDEEYSPEPTNVTSPPPLIQLHRETHDASSAQPHYIGKKPSNLQIILESASVQDSQQSCVVSSSGEVNGIPVSDTIPNTASSIEQSPLKTPSFEGPTTTYSSNANSIIAEPDSLHCNEKPKTPKSPVAKRSIEEISKKILDAREKIVKERIDWKKKLLYRLEFVLKKRLKKAERETGEKADIDMKWVPKKEIKEKKSMDEDKQTSEKTKEKQKDDLEQGDDTTGDDVEKIKRKPRRKYKNSKENATEGDQVKKSLNDKESDIISKRKDARNRGTETGKYKTSKSGTKVKNQIIGTTRALGKKSQRKGEKECKDSKGLRKKNLEDAIPKKRRGKAATGDKDVKEKLGGDEAREKEDEISQEFVIVKDTGTQSDFDTAVCLKDVEAKGPMSMLHNTKHNSLKRNNTSACTEESSDVKKLKLSGMNNNENNAGKQDSKDHDVKVIANGHLYAPIKIDFNQNSKEIQDNFGRDTLSETLQKDVEKRESELKTGTKVVAKHQGILNFLSTLKGSLGKITSRCKAKSNGGKINGCCDLRSSAGAARAEHETENSSFFRVQKSKNGSNDVQPCIKKSEKVRECILEPTNSELRIKTEKEDSRMSSDSTCAKYTFPPGFGSITLEENIDTNYEQIQKINVERSCFTCSYENKDTKDETFGVEVEVVDKSGSFDGVISPHLPSTTLLSSGSTASDVSVDGKGDTESSNVSLQLVKSEIILNDSDDVIKLSSLTDPLFDIDMQDDFDNWAFFIPNLDIIS